MWLMDSMFKKNAYLWPIYSSFYFLKQITFLNTIRNILLYYNNLYVIFDIFDMQILEHLRVQTCCFLLHMKTSWTLITLTGHSGHDLWSQAPDSDRSIVEIRRRKIRKLLNRSKRSEHITSYSFAISTVRLDSYQNLP